MKPIKMLLVPIDVGQPTSVPTVHPNTSAERLRWSRAATGTVAEIMSPTLLYIRAGDRLSLAKGQILKFGITAVPVLDVDHRPVGVVSLRDLVRRDEEPVASTPVLTVRATATIDEGARTLAQHDVHHLVVVDHDGVAVGMLSAMDLVRAMAGCAPRHPRSLQQRLT